MSHIRHTQFTTFLLVLLLDLQTGQLAPDSHVGNSTVSMIARTGHQGLPCRTKQIGQDNEKMTTKTGQRGKRTGDKNASAGQLGQGSLGRTARTRQPEKTGQLRWNNRGRKAMTVNLGHDI
jgi:hypothetical protein